MGIKTKEMKKHEKALVYAMLSYILCNVNPYHKFWFSMAIGWCIVGVGYYVIEIIKNK